MRLLTIAIVMFALGACQTAQPPEVEAEQPTASNGRDLALALLGEWHAPMSDGRSVFHEQWQIAEGGDLKGLGFVMSGHDTVFIEHLGIQFTDSGTWYSALIPTQHEGLPVLFKGTHLRDSLVFENAAHDFPQRITYAPLGDGAWDVTVRGKEQGEPRTERFLFRPRADLP